MSREVPRRRVVVTGLGAVTSLGNDVEAVWRAVLAGRSGVGYIQQFDSRAFPSRIGSEVDVERLCAEAGPDFPKGSRSAQFGLFALDRAWADAGLDGNGFDPYRAGVCVGASSFPVLEASLGDPLQLLEDEHYNTRYYLELCRERPELLQQRDISSICTLMSQRKGLCGISMAVQTACASATQAIGESFWMIRSGEVDLVVTGGTDSMMSVLCVTGFTLLGTLSLRNDEPQRASRPFDLKRDGFVIGEGAGILVLEELAHAEARGARIYAELIGYGSSSDGYRFTDAHPEGQGAIACMGAGLRDAGIAPEAVGYINAHGTATQQNDRTETLAIKQVFGDHARRLAISSTKSQLGHLVCAAGGIETLLTVLALRDGLLPPTINLEHPDPDCDLDYIPNELRRADVEVAMSNSFGFGGHNSSVVFRRWGD